MQNIQFLRGTSFLFAIARVSVPDDAVLFAVHSTLHSERENTLKPLVLRRGAVTKQENEVFSLFALVHSFVPA